MLRTSECMLWIQSMPRIPYVYLQMPIGCNWFVMHIHMGRAYFKARGIKKDSVPDMIEIELTNILVKSGIVYPDVDGFLYGPVVRSWLGYLVLV